MSMLISQYLLEGEVIQDAEFSATLFPGSSYGGAVCYALSPQVIERANLNDNVSTIITTSELIANVAGKKGKVVAMDPVRCYYDLHNKLVEMDLMPLVRERYIAATAVIASTAIIGKNVIIEDNVEISDGAQIADNSIIGAGTFIGPNVVIGTRGMQNLRVEGRHFNVKYAGGVKIGVNCEILANAIIQKPYQAFYTEIGNNTKISVKSSIGHGSTIGNNCLIAGNVTIAGNVKMGNDVWVGPSSTIADGLTVGSEARILIGSVVVNHIRDKAEVSGNFALDHHKQLKNFAILRKL